MTEVSGFAEWMRFLEERHLADLTFREVSRALRAVSSTYVERRRRIREGAALDGAGKRAAFALFYGPLHFLLIHHIVTSVPGLSEVGSPIVDLGCGTGAAGAAWASIRSGGVVAAYAINEVSAETRERLLLRLLAYAGRGGRVLVVEPLAGFVAPWWATWQRAFEAAGGRGDEWRIRPDLPPLVSKLDRAAGLDHREITGRALWIC
jgi:hypothetical protein